MQFHMAQPQPPKPEFLMFYIR
jgi:hypothetical protein